MGDHGEELIEECRVPEIVGDRGRSWEIMGDHGRLLEIIGDHELVEGRRVRDSGQPRGERDAEGDDDE